MYGIAYTIKKCSFTLRFCSIIYTPHTSSNICQFIGYDKRRYKLSVSHTSVSARAIAWNLLYRQQELNSPGIHSVDILISLVQINHSKSFLWNRKTRVHLQYLHGIISIIWYVKNEDMSRIDFLKLIMIDIIIRKVLKH